MKLSSWIWASLRRRRLLLIIWLVFQKLFSEVALDADTHNMCLAMMVHIGQRVWRSSHHVSAEAGHTHCIWELWYASTLLVMYKRRASTRIGAQCQVENTENRQGSKLVNWWHGGSHKNIKSKTHVGITIIGNINEGDLKLLKEISSHSWGTPSTVSGDSCGDQLPIGGPSLWDSSPLLRSSASHILADGWSTLHLAGLCNFLYTTPEGGRQHCSA